MNLEMFDNWFLQTVAGQYVAGWEKSFFKRFYFCGEMQIAVQAGMCGWLEPLGTWLCNSRDFYMDAGVWAWADESVDVLLMPHTLECSGVPYVTLAEAYRVMKPEGKVVLTGFNPYSLWGCSNWFDGVLLPDKKFCLPLQTLKANAKALGFEVVFGQFMVYVPPFDNEKLLRLCHFMEAAGNRWWPHKAAVYGLVLQKSVGGVHILPEYGQVLQNAEMVLGMAKIKSRFLNADCC
ncbi:class I SAM-dependent methyltransferase [Neisseria musculi]|uniref:Methyltransferase domain protein n=1 Tax=Neisseria musculi TaxID=1815583 RepID=A0ACD0ZKQ8_9NEIS|nr:methyltransferase domain-containing protein [Neisseria musculi]